MIGVEGLGKRYGRLVAVQGVDFVARSGEIFGLLGPNGAGKTTTIGCISGLLVPDEGSVRVLGHDVVAEGRASREQLGLVPQELALYEELSARENLSYWGSAYGWRGAALRGRVQEVLEAVGLADRAKEPVKRFSGGMKRRLNFACGIVHTPQVLLLDEPTVGVDPQSRVRILELVREQAQQGRCVLYTTHYMEEAEGLCDRLAVIDRGRIIASGTLGELRSIVGEHDIVRMGGSFDPGGVRRVLEPIPAVEVVQASDDSLTIAAAGATRNLSAIFEALRRAGAVVSETTLTQPSLESLFIKLTGKELRE